MENSENIINNLVPKATEVVLSIPSLEVLGELKGLKQVYKATAGYRTEEEWFTMKDKPVRCYYLGTKALPNDKGQLLVSAIFAGEDGVFIAAQKVLVDAVMNMKTHTPLEITFKGKKKNKSSEGSTNMFEVVILGGE